MAEPDRHRQTKGAETDAAQPTATAPHLDSTEPPHSRSRAGRSAMGATYPFAAGLAKVGNPPNSAAPGGYRERQVWGIKSGS
jgi:hypothetical protein